MKKALQKVLACAIVLTLVLSVTGGALASFFPSKAFRLPTVKPRPTQAPVIEPTEAPEGEEEIEAEATEAPAEVEQDAAPAEPASEEEVAEPVVTEAPEAEAETEPAAEEPAAEEPAEDEEPVTEEPAEDEEPVTEEPAEDEEPVTEEPAEAEEPAEDEEPATEEPAEDEEPVTEEPAEDEEPVTEEPAEVEEPATEEPAEVEEPAAEEPAEDEEPAEEEKETITGTAIVVLKNAGSSLNVRAAASTSAKRVATLKSGDEVSVYSAANGWTHIRTAKGVDGYVKSEYLGTTFPTEEPAVEEPATEEPATEEPAVEEPATEEPETEEPVVEEPAVEEPAAEEPAVEEPAVEEPETEEPAAEEPETEEPAAEEPATEEPATEEPAVEEPVEEPKVEEEAKKEVAASDEEPEAEPEAEPAEVEVAEDVAALGDADVRLEGDGLSEIFATIPDGTPLIVLGVEGDWVKVEIDGQIGYIYKDSVQGVEFEEPELPEEEKLLPKVTIFSSRRTVVEPGETITLTSKLENFEGYGELSFQWEYDRGNGFESVPGATGESYAFEATIETLSYNWRLAVFCND